MNGGNFVFAQPIMLDPKMLHPHPKRELYKTVPNRDSGTYRRIRDSIVLRGIEQPVKVQVDKNIILGGHTRWEIALELELPEVPVVFVNVNDEEAEEILVWDNFERALDEKDIIKFARVLKAYQDQNGFSHGGNRDATGPESRLTMTEIAAKFDMTERHFRRYVQLLKLIEPLQHACSAGQMGVKAGSLIATLEQERQVAFHESMRENLKSADFSITEQIAKSYHDACSIESDNTDSSWVNEFDESLVESDASESMNSVKVTPLQRVESQDLMELSFLGDEAKKIFDDINDQYDNMNERTPNRADKAERESIIRMADSFGNVEEKVLFYKSNAKTKLEQLGRSLIREENSLTAALNGPVVKVWDEELNTKLSTVLQVVQRLQEKLEAFGGLVQHK